MSSQSCPVRGAGLGLRRSFLDDIAAKPNTDIDFMEVAPENWMDMGGAYGRKFAAMAERYPMLCHGLSLSIGSPAPLDEHFVHRLKKFFDKHNICLLYTSDAADE